jgi:tight adherence protein C
VIDIDPRLQIALAASFGVTLLTAGVVRWRQRQRMHARVRKLAAQWAAGAQRWQSTGVSPRTIAGRLGASLAQRMPAEVGALTMRVDRAGLSGGTPPVELLGWKVVCLAVGLAVGLGAAVRYGLPGLVILVLSALIGWFGIDLLLMRSHAQRRRAILRALPTVMDLLVLSLEAGMSLDRALRTVIREYRSAVSDEIQRVLNDVDLGMRRGEAFERMAVRVGLDDLRSISRAIVQSEELGVSVVGVMQTQAHEVRLSRRRAAEEEALRAPIKMLIPLVIFILPTLFMLLLGPVGLRAADALTGHVP